MPVTQSPIKFVACVSFSFLLPQAEGEKSTGTVWIAAWVEYQYYSRTVLLRMALWCDINSILLY